MSRYDASDAYIYPDTAVLRNKADVREEAALEAFEADACATDPRVIPVAIAADRHAATLKICSHQHPGLYR